MKIGAVVLIFSLLVACGDRDPAGARTTQPAAENDSLAAELAQEEKQLLNALAITRAATRDSQTIELYEVGNQFDPDFEQIKANEKIAGYPIRRRVPISADAAAPLVDVLTNRSAFFEPGNGWMCIFEPHHVLRVLSAQQAVDVVICLKCGDVAYVASDRQLILKSVRPGANRKLEAIIETLMTPRPVV